MQDSRAIAAEIRAQRARLVQAIAAVARAFVGRPSTRAELLACSSRGALATVLGAERKPEPVREGHGGITARPIIAPVLA